MSNSKIKHILVALDASEVNKTALQAATSLAQQLDAELQALFVEDINLLHLAELPFAREMTYGSQTAKQLTLADMERQLQAQVERMRRIVETIAQQSQVKVQFNVARGQIEAEVCTAAQLTDLLIIGKNTQLLSYSEKVGRTTQGILTTTKCNVLLLQHGARIERPVAVLFDGSEAGQRALQLALQLAHGDHDKLAVFYPTSQQDRLQQQVDEAARPYEITPQHVSLQKNSPEAVLKALTHCQGRILLLEANDDILSAEQVQTLIEQSDKPVIIVR